MKKNILFLFLLFSVLAQAQMIKIEPETVTKVYTNQDLSDGSLQLQMYAKVSNLTGQNIQLKWTRVIVDQPIDWETQVCDNNLCYTPIVSSNVDASLPLNQPVIIKPDTSFEIGLYVVPNGAAGRGKFQLIFALASSPNTPIDTVTFDLSINQTTSTREIAKSDIRVFPNPAVDYFELTDGSDVDRIVVYNLLGREVRSFRSIGNGQQYNLSGLPDGLYLLSLLDNRRGIVKTVRLNKRSFRP